MNNQTKLAWTAAIVGGMLLWLLAAAIGGQREAWDSFVYWLFAYPLSIGLAGLIAYRLPEKSWRWGLAVMWSQALVLVVSGSDFSLLPLGLILFAILALPAIAFAKIMARKRLSHEG